MTGTGFSFRCDFFRQTRLFLLSERRFVSKLVGSGTAWKRRIIAPAIFSSLFPLSPATLQSVYIESFPLRMLEASLSVYISRASLSERSKLPSPNISRGASATDVLDKASVRRQLASPAYVVPRHHFRGGSLMSVGSSAANGRQDSHSVCPTTGL